MKISTFALLLVEEIRKKFDKGCHFSDLAAVE